MLIESTENGITMSPLTKTGKKVLRKMKKTYGAKKAKKVLHASIKKKNPGTKKWHRKKGNPKRKSGY
ncbi:MAG: hypothetical protein V3V81_08210 [Candidatus Bathyarchaeia archaeon]